MQHLAMVIALFGVLGIRAQGIAWRTGWQAIALMLLAGLLAGSATGPIVPERDLGHPAVSIAVAIILFESGLNLRVRELGV